MVAHTEDTGNEGSKDAEYYEQTSKDDLLAPTAIPSTSFYGANANTSFPQRRSTIGSSHTQYKAPTPPRRTEQSTPEVWRQPEAVDDDLPELIPSDSIGPSNLWHSEASWTLGDTFDDSLNSGNKSLMIDGRDQVEEKGWWDQDVGMIGRPGPGMLPPMMESKLHNPEHTLFTVSVTPPDIKPPVPTNAPETSSSPPPPSSPSQSSTSSSPPATAPSFTPPTPDEVRQAVPHPNAYYCRKHNGWVLLVCKSSNLLPPFVPSFRKSSPHQQLPDSSRRTRTKNCISDQPYGQTNKTHHFHEYPRSIDATSLIPPYRSRSWEREENAKHARRKIEVGAAYFDKDMVQNAVEGDRKSQEETSIVIDAKEAEESTLLLDLYVCCQCSLYVVVSGVIPGVIPARYIEYLTMDKYQSPHPGGNGATTVVAAWETMITVVENLLWKGNTKPLRIGGKAFVRKLGWHSGIKMIFESLGFTYKEAQGDEPIGTLVPPSIDKTTSSGSFNRERLLRAWVEMSSYTEEFRRRYADELKDYQPHTLWVKTDSARETYQRELGAHIDQIPRSGLPKFFERAPVKVKEMWEKLGLSSTAYNTDLFHFAYFAQCRCDPRNTKDYFTAVVEVDYLHKLEAGEIDNETMIVEERSRGRFTDEDLQQAASLLGFGEANDLKLELDDSVEDNFVLQAWKDKIRRSWTALDGAMQRNQYVDALRIIAQSRGSRELIVALENEQRNGMTPEKAYSTLEVPVGVDEEMLITIFNMRIEEQPSQSDKMRDALRVIAEVTESDRLRKFLETGMDPGDIAAQTKPDWPRGLNQLGNTCYLNSLLQYFYTIKDLRDAIAPLALSDDKLVFEERVDEDDLKKHRVGGRAITRSEVVRSRKFVSHLAELFRQLENSNSPAVTPSLDLAKLALVTSKDEEEDETDRGGTETSNSTDATLVDESAGGLRESPQPQRAKSESPPLSRSPSSVLGKRTRGVDKKGEGEDQATIDGASAEAPDIDMDGFVLVSKPPSPTSAGLENKPSGSDTPMTIDGDGSGDVEMQVEENVETPKAPPLPPRPKTQGSSEMMFGRQHDVAECMDNCMFQIETALLNLGAPLEVADSDKTSVVKRLFYGKMRQRLTLLEESKNHKASTHEREDHIAHLPVNVSDEQFDLYDGLSGYFDDVVDFNGAKARMEVSLIDLPPILQIQLQRVQFNRETMQAYKSHSYVKFGETIYMDRFMDDAPAEKKATAKVIQEELTQNRERVRQLTQSKYETIDNTWTFLSKQTAMTFEEVDETFLDDLKGEKERVEQELETCRRRAGELKTQLEEVWQDQHRVEYELTAVFVHRGASPTFGHYFIYQRWLPNDPDSWFKYNDSDVSMVTKDEVLADTTGSTANPYLLVYARKDSQVIQTVQRVVPDPDIMQI